MCTCKGGSSGTSPPKQKRRWKLRSSCILSPLNPTGAEHYGQSNPRIWECQEVRWCKKKKPVSMHWEGTFPHILTLAVFSLVLLPREDGSSLRKACLQNMAHHYTAEWVDQRQGEHLHSWAEGYEQPTLQHLATSPHQ